MSNSLLFGTKKCISLKQNFSLKTTSLTKFSAKSDFQFFFQRNLFSTIKKLQLLIEKYPGKPLSLKPENLSSFPLSSSPNRLFSTNSQTVLPSYSPNELDNRAKNPNLLRLITAYRRYGHIIADLDPLGLEKKKAPPELDLNRYALNKIDNSQVFELPGLINMGEKKTANLGEIIDHCKRVYCGKIGSEFLYLQQVDQRRWFSDKVELLPYEKIPKEDQKHIYELLMKAEAFDQFMQKKFPFVKRYSLEGGESMIPALDTIFKSAVAQGISHIVIGMPHRGRLNLLEVLLEYKARHLFWKVKGNPEFDVDKFDGIGDVLSHLGTSVDLTYDGKPLHVTLLQNPSHLEAISPVTMGKVRAKQEQLGKDKVLSVMIHGDAAFYGQGTIAETLALSNLPLFTTEGTVHIIVNNQLGFTTPPTHGRSSRYSADVGKIIDMPALHVNSDSPEDVVKASKIALDYRTKFKSDIILDIICYRRHGHNELDEPSFTQPIMYKAIRSRKSVVAMYAEKLEDEEIQTMQEVEKLRATQDAYLEKEFQASSPKAPDHLQGKWSSIIHTKDVTQPIQTGVSVDLLREIAKISVELPKGFELHQRLVRSFCQARDKAIEKDAIDWATAEALAFGSLLKEGHNIRISGQDVGRGTFSQRHLELTDQNTERTVVPLSNLSPGKIEVVNSPLSELAVLEYEYGYSLEDPNNLCIWEAQFGDFANGAQIAIDQFITCSESKWLKQTGLVVLLPHGQDGAGPEHSSGRPERFLQMCENDNVNIRSPKNKNTNMYVTNITTPANFFHALRRQVKTNYRKPLIVMSPKTILRLNQATSKLSEMGPGTQFHPVLDDPFATPNASRLVFCSGKIYYEIDVVRKSKGDTNTAIVRIEELAPFPLQQIESIFEKYGNASSFYWLQDEPQNCGAWNYIQPRILAMGRQLEYIGAPPCPTSAVGVSLLSNRHKEEINKALFP